jgi:hypothetical protein
MKNFLNAFYEFLHAMGKAKAATALARAGMHKEAKELMTN